MTWSGGALRMGQSVPNKTPPPKVEKVESEPRFRASIGDYSGRLRLLSGASNKANFHQVELAAGARRIAGYVRDGGLCI